MTKTELSVADTRNFVTLHQVAVMSTLSQTLPGYPFGSIVPYDTDDQGRLIIFVANISEHFRNLSKDPRASMFIADYYGLDDPQAHSRTSLIGDFARIAEVDVAAVSKNYWSRFPEAVEREIAHSFCYFRFRPQKIRWIGGFGEIRWIDAERYAAIPRDPIAYVGLSVLDHMNSDHADALCDFVRAFAQKEASQQTVKMNGIDSKGFSIAFGEPSKRERIRINFREALSTPDQVRSSLIEMLKEIRAASVTSHS
jgi:putative heme iron utilization protein